jgi:NAD(P)-dependent dehydrogenase (short-subunit alcohol dehydrogenase family)
MVKYGVTANCIAPLAHTRMADSVPVEQNPYAGRPDMSPDYIAPIVAYLASERSAWSTGRIYDAGLSRFKVLSYIDSLAEITTDGPWSLDDLPHQIEETLRPAAEANPNPILRAMSQL